MDRTLSHSRPDLPPLCAAVEERGPRGTTLRSEPLPLVEAEDLAAARRWLCRESGAKAVLA